MHKNSRTVIARSPRPGPFGPLPTTKPPAPSALPPATATQATRSCQPGEFGERSRIPERDMTEKSEKMGRVAISGGRIPYGM